MKNNLRIYHVEEIDTHGGSLRIYGCHIDSSIKENKSVKQLINKEKSTNLIKLRHTKFNKQIKKIKFDFLSFLLKSKKLNKKICGYGAAAKASTLINYCGIKNDLIDAVYDQLNLNKINFYQEVIPILHPNKIRKDKPDLIIIFPWNLSRKL